MKAIYQSINERGQLKATMSNVRQRLKKIDRYEKFLSIPELANNLDTIQTRQHINSLINVCVDDLKNIESLVMIYSQLFEKEFIKTKSAVQRKVSKQPIRKLS